MSADGQLTCSGSVSQTWENSGAGRSQFQMLVCRARPHVPWRFMQRMLLRLAAPESCGDTRVEAAA